MRNTYWIILGITLTFIAGASIYFNYTSNKSIISLQTINPDLLHEITNVLSTAFGAKVQIESIIQLTESDRRNLVLRIILHGSTQSMPTSVILKQSLMEDSEQEDKAATDRFARDWAGLQFISTLKTDMCIAPHFYGGSICYRFILLEDLGEQHTSLSSVLVSGDTQLATATLEQFMRCLGQLHAQSYGKGEDYQKIMNTLNPNAKSYKDQINILLSQTLPKLQSTLESIDIPYIIPLKEEIHAVITSVIAPGPFTTFIHGDCCPGNTFYNQSKNELLLIDFEWGYFRNALLDGTYLCMSMPNCWSLGSTGTIPEELIETLESIYRQELVKKIPAARDDEVYNQAYVSACSYWLIKIVLVIPYVLDDDKPVRSRIISELQAFISVAQKYDKLPHIISMAKEILEKLKVRWPGIGPMDLYPSFR